MTTFPPAAAIRLSPRRDGGRRDGAAITLSTHQLGAGPAVVFCHGFPDLAFGWRHQLAPIARAGFRAIAPDQRGYGASSAPTAVEAYGLTELTGDLVGLLDALEIERAVFVGHDWGGFVAWAMPILHPERVLGVAGICTPYMPFPSLAQHLALVDGAVERQYVAWFQQPGVAEAEMDAKVRPILTRILRSGTPIEELVRLAFADGRLDMNPFLNPEKWPPLGTPLDSPAVLEEYFRTYERTGFRGGVNWYRNIDRNAAEHPAVGTRRLELPALMVTAEWDPGLRPEFAEPMRGLCADLELHHVAKVGHWVQQEAPQVVNALLLAWLRRFGC
ncbi:MAG: alpha/beta hydrolase [Deltaproteobacteria bacterium]|nr:alpha/beta hydrolase [Deltaproteobacteria bacterium]